MINARAGQGCGPTPAALEETPLIAHILYRFDVGGLENGLVNLISGLPEGRFRHAVVCLDGFGSFSERLRRDDVQFYALDKRPGKDFHLYVRLWRLLRRLRPAIVHTRNLSALEAQVLACLAGVSARVHGEHGRDVFDLAGRNVKYNVLRRAVRPFVNRYTCVSKDLERWLVQELGVLPGAVTQIYNGVDAQRFRPRGNMVRSLGPNGFMRPDALVIGSVGRMVGVKDYPTLAAAFVALAARAPHLRERLRLVIAGDGADRSACADMLSRAGLAAAAWFPGERSDVPEIMRTFDLFVLPSLGEGISNTLLEAMATALPVVATRVGGNPELIDEGVTGLLVSPGDPVALAGAMHGLLQDDARRAQFGRAARARVEACFGIEAMVSAYLAVYEALAPQRMRDPLTWSSSRPSRAAAFTEGRE